MQTILAVDDEVENLTMVEYTLQDEFEVVAVNSGKVALKYLEHNMPDLILLDIRMPEMDGLETMEAMKKIEGVENIPFIFLTSSQDIETEYTCFEMGAVEFIRKPFEPKIMKQRVKRILRLFGVDKQNEDIEPKEDKQTDAMIELTINGMNVMVREMDIFYIEVYNNNCLVKTENQEWNIRATLEKMQDMLLHDFIRTGRSYLINPHFVSDIDDDLVTMQDGKIIKLPRRNKKELVMAIMNRKQEESIE